MHPLELLALNEKLIFKIHKLSDLSTKDFNELVMPLISKLAEWVLTLPASQGCHDIGAGGIFIHSLRVFLVALEDLHQNLGNLVYEHKRQVVPALGLVALSHDLGKLQTDFEIFAENNKRFEVNELDSSLAKFMAQERSSYIKVKYKKNRSSRHNNLIADVRQKLMHACPQCFKGYSEVLDPIVLRSSKLNTKDLDEAFIEAQKRRKQNNKIDLTTGGKSNDCIRKTGSDQHRSYLKAGYPDCAGAGNGPGGGDQQGQHRLPRSRAVQGDGI